MAAHTPKNLDPPDDVELHEISGNLDGCHYCHTCRDWFDNRERHKAFIANRRLSS